MESCRHISLTRRAARIQAEDEYPSREVDRTGDVSPRKPSGHQLRGEAQLRAQRNAQETAGRRGAHAGGTAQALQEKNAPGRARGAASPLWARARRAGGGAGAFLSAPLNRGSDFFCTLKKKMATLLATEITEEKNGK